MSVASLAVPWMHPPPGLANPARPNMNDSGSPMAPAIQSVTRISSSVAAGLVAHDMPLTLSPAETSSPRIAGPEAWQGK